MSTPISPEPVTHAGTGELPAYVSNGLIGLRVLDIPLLSGVVLVSGFTGLHPVVQVEAAAKAPYPIAGDIGLDKVWLSTAPQQAEFIDQRYDFSNGELTTRFSFRADGATALITVLTLCSQKQPTIVLQEIAVEVDAACDLVLRAYVDISQTRGRIARRTMSSPGEPDDGIEGSIAGESVGGQSRCGIAFATEFRGDASVDRKQIDWGLESSIATDYAIRARPGRTYRLRQIASVVPSRLHGDPDRAAARLAARAAADGFETLREENRLEWAEHWKGRILITADDDRWQRLADAAFFYLNSSVHASAPSSTSMYGLGQWDDYHYYYGHVMWDIEMFCIPPLLLLQPDAARGMLEYRATALDAARSNAKLHGRRGVQFPWESGPLRGEEASPGLGRSSWHEDHVSLDVAWAFAQYAHATADRRFETHKVADVLYGVADWIVSRVTQTRGRVVFRQTMGIAETQTPHDHDAFTVMGAITVLREAIACAGRLRDPVPPAWTQILAALKPPTNARTGAIITHAGFHPNEEKGATPGPLAGLFPLWYDVEPKVARATLDYYLRLAPDYVGSPMLSALYGTWAAWAGDRPLARRLLEEGYADLIGGRFTQTLEMSPTRFPEKPPSGPFFANLGGFLMNLLFGLPGIRIGAGDPEDWPSRPVVLPAGWRSIEVERAWIRTQPARILARHGDDRATIEIPGRRRTRAA